MGRLKHSGSTTSLRRQLFPTGFAGEVMLHIVETWRDFALDINVRHETRITAVFRQALINAYVTAGRSWFVTLEDPITEPSFGTELGRNDLRFYPPDHHGQTIFFTVECKRLRVTTASGFDPRIGDYVDKGVLRFVTGQYSSGLPCGAMIGYVMDNNLREAFASVRSQIELRRGVLKISSKEALCRPSTKLPNHEWSADTLHKLKSGDFVVHHVLLGAST